MNLPSRSGTASEAGSDLRLFLFWPSRLKNVFTTLRFRFGPWLWQCMAALTMWERAPWKARAAEVLLY